jgi:3-oxoacyl-[acyl-carrier-protein] synthase II
MGMDMDIPFLWSKFAADERICPVPSNHQELVKSANLSCEEASILGRYQLLALSAVESAWQEARWAPVRNRIRGQCEKIRNGRIGCFGGSALGGLVTFELEHDSRPSAYSLTRWRGNAVVATVSVRYGLGGASLAINAASASGAQAIVMAGEFIRSGILDAAVVVLADCAPAPKIRGAMHRNGSVARSPEHGPLTRDRNGMYPSEGAAAIILESHDALKARGGKPICEWVGGKTESEAFHLVASDPSGDVLRNLLQFAKELLPGSNNHWLSLHATGTRIFDAIEMQVIRDVFADQKPWISAIKRTTGHTLGAAGVLDAVMLSEGLRVGQWPAWPRDVDPLFGVEEPKSRPRLTPNKCIQIGQGMGGVVAVNLWRRAKGT